MLSCGLVLRQAPFDKLRTEREIGLHTLSTPQSLPVPDTEERRLRKGLFGPHVGYVYGAGELDSGVAFDVVDETFEHPEAAGAAYDVGVHGEHEPRGRSGRRPRIRRTRRRRREPGWP